MGCFVFNYTVTEEREHAFLSYLASFIVSLCSWWLRCLTVLLLQASLWPLMICILLTILLPQMRQEINWIAWLKQGTKLILARWVLSLVHWDLQIFPFHPLFLALLYGFDKNGFCFVLFCLQDRIFHYIPSAHFCLYGLHGWVAL